MEDIEKTKKKRKAHRGVVTRIVNKTEEILKEDKEKTDYGKLQQYTLELKEKGRILTDLDNTMLDLLIENEENDEACEEEAIEASEIQEKIGLCLRSIEETLIFSHKAESVVNASGTNSNPQVNERESVGSSIGQNTNDTGRKVKLPKLELKRFSGRIAEWQEFWDGFRSAIHEDESLAKVDKFKYLRNYLEEPARSVVTGFSLTDANYDSAVELLRKRYAKPSVIKRAHLNDIINLAPVFSEKNVTRLRVLHDQIETHFRAMEAQGIKKESYPYYPWFPWILPFSNPSLVYFLLSLCMILLMGFP